MDFNPINVKKGEQKIPVEQVIDENVKYLMNRTITAPNSEALSQSLSDLEEGLKEKQEYERLMLYIALVPATTNLSAIAPFVKHIAQMDNGKWLNACRFLKQQFKEIEGQKVGVVTINNIWRQFMMRCIKTLRIVNLKKGN